MGSYRNLNKKGITGKRRRQIHYLLLFYLVDSDTNRYTEIGGEPQTYDAAGNLTMDWLQYHYSYDYENRLIEVYQVDLEETIDIAEYAYDALGRRIEKYDAQADQTVRYYHNNNWQVLTETDESNNTLRWYVYGNYIDEPLMMHEKK